MFVFGLKRLLQGLVVLFLLSVGIFMLIRLMPGDPAGSLAGAGASLEEVETIRRGLGLDKPLITQYALWVRRLVANEEISIKSRRLVSVEIADRVPYTFLLGAMSMAIAVMIAIPLGVVSAVRRDSTADRAITFAAVTAIAAPAYLIGIFLISAFAVQYRLLPVGGVGTVNHWVLPAIALVFTPLGTIIRTTRASVVDALRSDYVRTARSKGLPPRTVLYKHVLRNSLIPVTAVVGVDLGSLLAGMAVTEAIFSWPGLGRLMVDAVRARDYPMIQSLVVFFGAIFIAINLLVDIIYSALDPRISRA